MNKIRRRLIEGSRNDLDVVKEDLASIRSDELREFADTNITMQSFPSRQQSENNIRSLTDVISHVHKAIDKLDIIP